MLLRTDALNGCIHSSIRQISLMIPGLQWAGGVNASIIVCPMPDCQFMAGVRLEPMISHLDYAIHQVTA